jgi:caffeoyl-CoA O-methyltransferase
MELGTDMENYILSHLTPEDDVLQDLYRQTYLGTINPRMIAGHLQGRILEFISKMIRPEYILEIGTFTGYSAICLARGLREEGQLHTIEINDEWHAMTAGYISRAGLSGQIVQHTGNALEIIPGLPFIFDLVYIDGEKGEYPEYYQAVISKVRPGGFILADNVLWGGRVLKDDGKNQHQTNGVRRFNDLLATDTRIENAILPVRDGIMLIRKKPE